MAFYELKDTSKMSQEEITKSGLQPVMTQTEMEVNDETFGVGRIKDCGAGLVTVAGSNNMLGILVSIPPFGRTKGVKLTHLRIYLLDFTRYPQN